MTGELIPAFVEALKGLTVVAKGAASDQFGGYRYADLGDIIEAVHPALAAQGLALTTPVSGIDDGRLAVTVTLYHTSGEVLEFRPLPFPFGKDAQATGSTITYYRRYALLAALGMAAGEANPIGDLGDDDGAGAQPARTPGFRTSVVAAVAKLTDEERADLRAWCTEQGYPIVPAEMSETQLEDVLGWLMPDPTE